MQRSLLFALSLLISICGFAQETEESSTGPDYIAAIDLFSVAGGIPDIRFEVTLNDQSSLSFRTLALEDDSLQLSLGVLSYRIYPIQGLGKAPKGFYLGPRLYKGAINEVPEEGDGAWREVVRGIGIGVETGFQFNFDFGMVVDLGIGFNFSDQVIQFSGDETEDGFTVWPHPNVGIGWKF
ncbi:MAG: hypothetical protein ISQ97_06920 [Flavobacteriales bacterium]|nr:hypothetical protein [Flavobacteriales bacterium]